MGSWLTSLYLCLESGKIFYSDERGGGEREGPKHSLMNTSHIDYHTHRFGANKSKAQAQHTVLPGSAKDGIAQQGMTRRPSPAKDTQRSTVKPARSMGARHFNSNRGESKTYISSLSSNGYEYNSRPPHSTPSTVSGTVFYVPGT